MSRRSARAHGFCLIYQFPWLGQFDAKPQPAAASLAEAIAAYFDGLNFNEAKTAKLPNKTDQSYINRVTAGTLERLVQIDSVISHFLKDWDISRINRVDLAIMRLAIFEMLCEDDVPMGVAVNEAIELAKLYGGDDSAKFINGVLANIVRAYEGKPRRGEVLDIGTAEEQNV